MSSLTNHPRRISVTNGKLHWLGIRPVKYLISGGVYFWSGYLIFALLWSGFGWRLWWAKLAASLVGWSLNFVMQHFWVFNTLPAKRRSLSAGIRYAIITVVDFLLDYLIVANLHTAGITPYIGQFVSASALTLWNYYWYRFWVFPAALSKGKVKVAVHG